MTSLGTLQPSRNGALLFDPGSPHPSDTSGLLEGSVLPHAAEKLLLHTAGFRNLETTIALTAWVWDTPEQKPNFIVGMCYILLVCLAEEEATQRK